MFGPTVFHKFSLLLLLVAACVILGGECRPQMMDKDSNRVSEPILPPPLPTFYDFGYEVKSAKHKTDFGHTEKRVGDSTNGEYRVLLPDGRIQVVTYFVDGNSGFVAKVSYI